jgi:hypothetical protein
VAEASESLLNAASESDPSTIGPTTEPASVRHAYTGRGDVAAAHDDVIGANASEADVRRKILGMVRMYGVACSNYADTKRRGDNGIYTAKQDAAIAEGYFAQIERALAGLRPDYVAAARATPAENERVVCSIRSPGHVCHLPSQRCAIQEPHRIDECGEFDRATPAEGGQRAPQRYRCNTYGCCADDCPNCLYVAYLRRKLASSHASLRVLADKIEEMATERPLLPSNGGADA